MDIEGACGAPPFPDRRIEFAIDAEQRSIHHFPSSCAYETTYGTTGIFAQTPSNIGSSFATDSGVFVEHNESAIALFGFE